MKKVLILLFIAIFILLFSITYPNEVSLSGYEKAEIYTLDNGKYYLNTDKKTVMGMSIYTIDEKHLSSVLTDIEDVICVQYTYKAIEIEEILSELKAKIVMVEHLDGISIYYAYSKKIDEVVNIKNNLVNVQIAVKADSVQVGIPFIAGSY